MYKQDKLPNRIAQQALLLFLPIVLLTVVLTFASGSAFATAKPAIRVAVISPQGPKNPFWANTLAFMADAARDLGVTLEVHYANGDPTKPVSIAKSLLARQSKRPQYLFYTNERRSGLRILDLAEKAGVYSIMIVGGLSLEDTKKFGGPRQRFKRWLGEVVGDDYRGAYSLGKTLLDHGAKRRLHDGKRLGMHLILSHREDALAQLRFKGLEKAISDTPSAVLGEVGFAQRDYKRAIKQTEKAFTAWSNARLYTAENDLMALGVSNTITKRSRLQVNVDVLVGSFGWSKVSLNAAAKSQITAVLGGQFISGAAAVLLAHDHARGQDFATKGVSFKITQGMVNKDNVRRIAPLLTPKNWNRIDFRKFSHYYFQNRTSYEFSIVTFLKEILQPS